MYVPILDTLQAQLNNATVIQEVCLPAHNLRMKDACECTPSITLIATHEVDCVLFPCMQINGGHNDTPGFLSDYCDGQQFHEHPLLSSTPCLQIILYYDELEICNPLGSRRKKHKVGKLDQSEPTYIMKSLSMTVLYCKQGIIMHSHSYKARV